MTYTQKLITELKQKLDVTSDYAIAKALGITGQHMNQYKKGGQFSDDMALKVASLLEKNAVEVLADLHLESCKAEHAPLWEQLKASAANSKNLILCKIADLVHCFTSHPQNKPYCYTRQVA